MEEMTISVKDLLLRILLKWRLILVWMLIGAVVLDGVGYVRSARAVKLAQEAIKTPEDDEEQMLLAVSQAEEKLSTREVSEVQTAVGTYLSYQKEYRRPTGRHRPVPGHKRCPHPTAVPPQSARTPPYW